MSKMGSRFEKIACTSMSPSAASQRLAQLEQVLVRRMPQSVHMLILCRIGLQQKFPKGSHIEFYRYTDASDNDDDNWHTDLEKNSFIVCIQTPNMHSTRGIVILPPERPATPEMITTFDDFIGWDVPQLFHSVPNPFSDHIRELCISHKNLKKEDSYGILCSTMVMLDIEKAKKLDTSYKDPNIKLEPLQQKHVPEIVESWTWGGAHSGKVIADCVESPGGVGAFTKDGEMASSVMINPIGACGILYTPDKFRRRGLGHLVIRALCKKMANELGIHPLGEVEVGNVPSKSLFEKVGFEEAYRMKYIYFNPSSSAIAEAS